MSDNRLTTRLRTISDQIDARIEAGHPLIFGELRDLAHSIREIAEEIDAQNPGRGQSAVAGSQRVAPSACGSDRGTSLRTIDQVLALAEADRGSVVSFPRGLRIVPAADGGAAI